MFNADAMSADAASLVVAAAPFGLACYGLATVALLGYIAWVVRDGLRRGLDANVVAHELVATAGQDLYRLIALLRDDTHSEADQDHASRKDLEAKIDFAMNLLGSLEESAFDIGCYVIGPGCKGLAAVGSALCPLHGGGQKRSEKGTTRRAAG